MSASNISRLTDVEFREALTCHMASDPVEAPNMERLLDQESVARGFDNWVTAYHWFDKLERQS